MKKIIFSLCLFSLFTIKTFSFTYCKSEKLHNKRPLFSISIYENTNIKAIVTDLRVSRIPFSYICQKSTLTENQNKLSIYDCDGGSYNQQNNMALFVNITASLANYINEDNQYDLQNLICIFSAEEKNIAL